MSLLDRIKELLTGQPGSDSRRSGNSAPVVKPSTIGKPSSPPPKAGDVEVRCPYCGCTLEKKPVRKKKCVACGNYIYVKTTPTDRMKVLVTEQQATEIETQWERYYQEKEREQLENDPEYRQMRARLEVNQHREPSVNDVRWALSNKQLLQHARKRDWGLYRNVKLDMAEILQKEKKLRDSLRTYLEICYLDVNGPCNLGGERDPDMLKMYPPFDPTQGFIAPGIIWEIRELSKSLGLQADEVKSLFMERAKITHRSQRLPIVPDEAWDRIRLELEAASSDTTMEAGQK